MPVPRMIQLQRGALVNIVLKADQPTGKLTTGTIADFLTRGDHPRGIKVRLSDGKIGRVQSLAPNTQQSGIESQLVGPSFETRRSGPSVGHLQQDYRIEEQQEEDSSLFDYVKIKPAKKSKTKRRAAEKPDDMVDPSPDRQIPDTGAMQSQMESEFPDLDPALIAAILSDHESWKLPGVFLRVWRRNCFQKPPPERYRP